MILTLINIKNMSRAVSVFTLKDWMELTNYLIQLFIQNKMLMKTSLQYLSQKL